MFPETIGIIADDLTGANDTALQFFLKDCPTRVLLDYSSIPENISDTQIWAVSTESRNIDAKEAKEKVSSAVLNLIDNIKVSYLYKKIDSTMRGNIAEEIMAIVKTAGYDAAIIMPAFPNEGRITLGGYQLLKGIPIERTELARDPKYPIFESSIPSILKQNLDEKDENIVDLIDFNTVKQGAGPILSKLNKQIENGKKLIVIDAVSTVDLEQIVLAMKKSNKKILPCGSAGAASVIGKIWTDDIEIKTKQEPEIPALPRLVISGSATDLTATQVRVFENSDEIENIYSIKIQPSDILNDNKFEIIEKAVRNLNKTNTVIIHTSELFKNPDKITEMLFEKEISRDDFISEICDYLADITQSILAEKEAILITIGGETSYKCSKSIGDNGLKIVDAVLPAIPLCIDKQSRYIVTKSGNLGSSGTIVDILKYFDNKNKQ